MQPLQIEVASCISLPDPTSAFEFMYIGKTNLDLFILKQMDLADGEPMPRNAKEFIGKLNSICESINFTKLGEHPSPIK
jgi:hypothetical protein